MGEDRKTYPTKIWLSFDWKQAEMYFLCLFSKDSVLKQALYSQDFHSYVASLLDNISIEDVNPTNREIAKAISFNLIYSGFNAKITMANILKKRPDLDEDQVSDMLDKYQSTFFCLFNWVKKSVLDWRDNAGYMTYFMGAKKFIPVPKYVTADCDPDKLLYTKQGRLCINTFGQNSVGLLLKSVCSKIFSNALLREKTTQYIPLFDSLSFLADTENLDYILRAVDEYATPIITHDGFEISMKVDWSISDKSWGDLKKFEYVNECKNKLYYQWDIV